MIVTLTLKYIIIVPNNNEKNYPNCYPTTSTSKLETKPSCYTLSTKYLHLPAFSNNRNRNRDSRCIRTRQITCRLSFPSSHHLCVTLRRDKRCVTIKCADNTTRCMSSRGSSFFLLFLHLSFSSMRRFTEGVVVFQTTLFYRSQRLFFSPKRLIRVKVYYLYFVTRAAKLDYCLRPICDESKDKRGNCPIV